MSAHRRRRHPRTHHTPCIVQPLERRTLLALALDPTFGRGGVGDNLVDGDPNDFGLQPGFIHQFDDGKLLVGGLSFDGGEPGMRVARYTKGGVLDPTFNGDGLSGRIDTPNGGGQNAGGAVQGDGKVLVAGTMFGTLGVVRFNADGSVDTGFGGGDAIATAGDFGGGGDDDRDISTAAMALAADGKITLVGHEFIGQRILLARFNANGTPDTTFSGDGRHTIDMDEIVAGSGDVGDIRATDIVALPGGKVALLANIRINAQGASQPAVVQLNADASYDTAFSGDGRLPFKFGNAPSGNTATTMLLQGDDIVVAGLDGTSDDSEYANRAALARFNADGSLDAAFGDNGIGFAGAGGLSEGISPFGLTVDPDGRFVGNSQFHLFRWTAGGDADTTFGPGGEVALPRAFAIDGPILVDDADRIILGSNTRLVRLTDQPRPQLTLGDNGTLVITGETGTADNTVTIAQSGSNVVFTRNGVASNFAAADVRALDALMFDGDDTITSSVDLDWSIVVLGNGNNELTLADGDTSITGGNGADDITVGDGSEHQIDIAAGNDTVVTGDGPAVITAGEGNDSIATGGSHDNVDAGDGNDTVNTGAGPDTVLGGAGNDSITGGADGDFLVGGATLDGVEDPDGANVIHGGDGNDILVGAWHRDSLYGGANNDYLLGSSGSDLLSGGGGNDRVKGGGGNDRVYGGNGSDRIHGGVHDDRVAGGAGDDWIVGGRGADTLNGDDGLDRFFAVDAVIDAIDGGAGDDTAERDDDDILTSVT